MFAIVGTDKKGDIHLIIGTVETIYYQANGDIESYPNMVGTVRWGTKPIFYSESYDASLKFNAMINLSQKSKE